MGNPLRAEFGPFKIRLAVNCYLNLGPIDGDQLQFDSGDTATRMLISGRPALFVDHRLDRGRPARTEVWIPDEPVEGNLACIVVLCDSRRSARTDGGWQELQHIVDGIEVASRR